MIDLTIYKGVSWQRTFTITRESDGARVSLTGATIEFRIKRRTNDPDPPLILLVPGGGLVLADQTNESTKGDFTATIAGAASLLLEEANHVLAVFVTPSGSTIPQPAIKPTKIPVRDAP